MSKTYIYIFLFILTFLEQLKRWLLNPFLWISFLVGFISVSFLFLIIWMNFSASSLSQIFTCIWVWNLTSSFTSDFSMILSFLTLYLKPSGKESINRFFLQKSYHHTPRWIPCWECPFSFTSSRRLIWTQKSVLGI